MSEVIAVAPKTIFTVSAICGDYDTKAAAIKAWIAAGKPKPPKSSVWIEKIEIDHDGAATFIEATTLLEGFERD